MKELSLRKLYYSISEVSKMTDLEPYILRYWETEFDELKPQKNRAGNRIYTHKDIKLIIEIKRLLRDEKYTSEGAKNILKERVNDNGEREDNLSEDLFSENEERNIKKDLEELRRFLLDLKSKL